MADFDLNLGSSNCKREELCVLCEQALLKNTFIATVLSDDTFIKNYIVKITEIIKDENTDEDDKDEKIANITVELIRELILAFGFTDGLAFDLLRAWQSYEKINFIAKTTYREHFIHQFHVFLLGCLFLEEILKKTKEKEKILPKGKFLRLQADNEEQRNLRFIRRWFLAAVFHDVGYPAETLSELQKTLHYKYFNKIPNFGIKEIKLHEYEKDDNVKRLVEKISLIHLLTENININDKNLAVQPMLDQSKFKNEMSFCSPIEIQNLLIDEIKQTRDHGVVGAIFFLKTALIDLRELVYFYDEKIMSPHADFQKRFGSINMLEEDLFVAAAAISGHNIRSYTYPNYTAEFASRPIGALLNLCDDLQEWGRRTQDVNWRMKKVKLLKIKSNRNTLAISFDGKSLTDKRKQCDFVSSLQSLFNLNLSDDLGVFFDEITIDSFQCGHMFVAKRYTGITPQRHRKYGRYHTFMAKSKTMKECDYKKTLPNCFNCKQSDSLVNSLDKK